MSVKRIVISTGLAALLVFSATPAMATTATPEQRQERLDRACARVPNLTARVESVLVRIQGDADTVGSIAWLENRADEARANGRDGLAELIENRIAFRTERIDVLVVRLDNLAEAAAACDAR
ncbi:MAG TPA: hypothetical protein VM848_14075 [Acidimicrobiia bacterium]|nr:hypothetical protein [Acidimicrobiia bacterium]